MSELYYKAVKRYDNGPWVSLYTRRSIQVVYTIGEVSLPTIPGSLLMVFHTLHQAKQAAIERATMSDGKKITTTVFEVEVGGERELAWIGTVSATKATLVKLWRVLNTTPFDHSFPGLYSTEFGVWGAQVVKPIRQVTPVFKLKPGHYWEVEEL